MHEKDLQKITKDTKQRKVSGKQQVERNIGEREGGALSSATRESGKCRLRVHFGTDS
jgi:hypothetical protein